MTVKVSLTPIIILLLSFAFVISNPNKALSQKKAETIDNPADEAFMQGARFLMEGLLDESISSFAGAENEYRKSGNEQRVIACYLGIAACYSLKDDFRKSLEFNEKALTLHKSRITDDPEGLNLIISNIALCQERMQRKSND